MSQVYCLLDYETYSETDLKKVGVYEYSMHPSTEILCAAWRIGTAETLKSAKIERWSPWIKGTSLSSLIRAFSNEKIILVAHNASFERIITRNVLNRYLVGGPIRSPYTVPIKRWLCTAAQCAALALPRKLEHACDALNLPVKKDMEGHKLMLKLSKPRKPTKNNPAKRHNKIKDLIRVMDYNVIDVEADTQILLRLPKLIPSEQRLWELDQLINDRGFLADRELVENVLKMIKTEKTLLDQETVLLTKGKLDTANQRAAVMNWLKWQGVHLPNLQAKTVQDAISHKIVEGDALRMLEIRQAVSKTSTAKFGQFELRSRHDGRCRDGQLFHGASTGRWTGRGLQPHNFPQGKGVPDYDFACDVIKKGDLELVRLLYGDPINFFSSCLRSVIVAPEKKNLFVGDYAGIELRIVFWLAEHEKGLKSLRKDEDLYVEMACHIFNKKADQITHAERDIGKRAVLGCGFGMGKDKFHATCHQYGVEISEALASKAVLTYRKVHNPVPKLWYNLENAAIQAVKNPDKKFKINKTVWYIENEFLFCELPSGRRLAYYGPEIKYDADHWGNKKATLYHWGIHPLTKKWVLQKTWGGTLTENCVQACARDVMKNSMFILEEHKIETILMVHDEIIGESDSISALVFEKLMASNPKWAKDLPLRVKAWAGPRYKKG